MIYPSSGLRIAPGKLPSPELIPCVPGTYVQPAHERRKEQYNLPAQHSEARKSLCGLQTSTLYRRPLPLHLTDIPILLGRPLH